MTDLGMLREDVKNELENFRGREDLWPWFEYTLLYHFQVEMVVYDAEE